MWVWPPCSTQSQNPSHLIVYELIIYWSSIYQDFSNLIISSTSSITVGAEEDQQSTPPAKPEHLFDKFSKPTSPIELSEANSHDQINMTKIRVRTWPKNFHNANLKNWTWSKNMTMTNINFTPKNMLVRPYWTGPPAPACKLARSGTPAHLPTVTLLLYKKKKNIGHSGKKDPGTKIKVCCFQFWSCLIVNVHCCHGLVILIRSCKYSSIKLKKTNLWFT